MRLLCSTCHGLRGWPRPLPFYHEAPCNNPWHPLKAFLRRLDRYA